MDAMRRAREAMMAVHMYAADNADVLPASIDDLGTYLRPGALPDDTFSYIGDGRVKLSDLPDISTLAAMHLNFDRAIDVAPSETSPGGLMLPIAFLDGHVEMHSPDIARWIIDDSIATFGAIAEGAELPERRQILLDLALIHKAVIAYVGEHDGHLPASLGEVFPFVPDSSRHMTMTEKASVLLTPGQRKRTALPAEPTVEWMDRNTSYVYLGNADARLDDVVDPRRTMLVHVKPELAIDSMNMNRVNGKFAGVLYAGGNVSLSSVAFVRAMGAESKDVVAAAGGHGELGEYYDSFSDLDVLSSAVAAYTRTHDGLMPAHIGDVVGFLPERYADADAATRAGIFVTRSMMRPEFSEMDITPEWVQKYCSYTYIGDASVELRAFLDVGGFVMLCSPIDQPMSMLVEGGDAQAHQERVVLIATPGGWVMGVDAESVEQHVKESRAGLKKIDR